MCNLPKFKDGDTICFFGDSITANGLYMAEVYQEIRKKYKVKCYNCGVSGTTAGQATTRLYSHCLIHSPNYVVVMFGMNDVRGRLYSDSCSVPNKETLKSEDIARHYENYEWIISEIVNHGATPIMCVPTPYDDVSNVPAENYNCNKGLEACGENVRSIHKKYGGFLVDFYSTMAPMLGKESIICSDRVHPTPLGYHVMAQTFLYQLKLIDEPIYDIPFEMEAWNQERYNAEKIFEEINYIEYCLFNGPFRNGNLTIEQKKELVKGKLPELDVNNARDRNAYTSYIEKVDFREELMAEVIRLTI